MKSKLSCSAIKAPIIQQIACQRGIIQAGDRISLEAVGDLIFVNGFSTAEGVTDISGRGIGMNAVRKYIESEGGTVHLSLLEAPESLRPVQFTLNILLAPHCYVIFDSESI